jgi:ubiquinone/menaquinone biosynthesis C-methylase UbiE
MSETHENLRSFFSSLLRYVKTFMLACISKPPKINITTKSIKNSADTYATIYDESRYVWVRGYLGRLEVTEIRRVLRKKGAHQVMQIGVGTGRIMLNNKIEHIGIDISASMLKVCREKWRCYKENGQLILMVLNISVSETTV